MASTLVLLLHLLLVSLVSASHNFGGSATYSYKGKNSDGTFEVSRNLIDMFQIPSQTWNFTLLYDLFNIEFAFLLWLHKSDYRKNIFTKAREACEHTDIYLQNISNK